MRGVGPPRARLTGLCATISLAALIAVACGKKKEEPIVSAPPPRGAASSDELSTGLGQARGIPEDVAPTSAKWRRVLVLDDKRAILAGEVGTEAIALITDDAGKSWKSMRAERESWSNWSAAPDGTIVLALGSRDGAATATSGTVEAARLLFATFESPTLSPPSPLFPALTGPAKGLLQTDGAIPALLSAGSAALVGEEGPRKPFVFYGGKPGAEASPPLKLPPAEKVVPTPYGRPPALLSVRGRDLVVRPIPPAGKPIEIPKKINGVTATPSLVAELGTTPACDAGEWSYQRIKQGKKLGLLAVSQTRQAAFMLPDSTAPTTRIGCGHGRVIVEATDEKAKAPTLLFCDLAGKCATPTNPPFRLWPEQHERQINAVPTEQGVVATLSARAGERWGLYLAQAPEGLVYERPRVIGEGSGDRGRVELGALVSLGKRTLLLISADVTGTSHRGWFVMVSDDGGTNWNPP